ncbi:MAG: hypothetical protein ACFFEA_04230 [Candidatus Thorarchaeota archaeon]
MPSDLRGIQLVPDPEFSSASAVVINGTSDEFYGAYSAGTEEEHAAMILNWSHVANTQLGFKDLDLDDSLPPCNDFVYFFQELDWIYNIFPDYVNMSIEFKVDFSGSFLTEDRSTWMFALYIWFIDSSNNWQFVCAIDTSYPENQEYLEHGIAISWTERNEIFGGMIAYENGTQDDPSDAFQLAIGLSPTEHFEYDQNSGSEPWTYYDGSVEFSIRRIKMDVIADLPPFTPIEEPVYFGSENGGASSRFRAMTMAPNDEVYTVGSLSVNQNSYSQMLVKWSSTAQPIWTRNLENMTAGSDVDMFGNGIYTGGSHSSDILLVKWDDSGNVVWRKEWEGGAHEYCRSICVGPSGSVYVGGATIGGEPPDEFWNSVLLQYDPDGNLLWNLTLTEKEWWPAEVSNIEVTAEEELLVQDYGYLYKLHSDGSQIWNITSPMRDFTIDSKGNIISVWTYEGAAILTKLDANGSQLWNRTIEKTIFGSLKEYMDVPIVATGLSDDIFVNVMMAYSDKSVLFKFNSEGDNLWNKTLLDLEDTGYGGPYEIAVGANGLLYAGIIHTDVNEMSDVRIHVYDIGYVPFQLSQPLVALLAGAAASSMVIVLVYLYKKRKAV